MHAALHIAVVGGGAAGMTAAIAAARSGARVTLLERQDRVGRKLLATGNGRCNLVSLDAGFGRYITAHPDCLRTVLGSFTVDRTLAFFHELGVCTTVEGGRVYPLSDQASTVLDVLRMEMDRLGVIEKINIDIETIDRNDTGFSLRGSGGGTSADRVIVATGGKAAPQLGGTERGIGLLQRLGHQVAPLYPALVPLTMNYRFGRQCKGVRVDAALTLEGNGVSPVSERGEVLFTEYGLSGIPALQLGAFVNDALRRNRDVGLRLDLLPDWNDRQVLIHLTDRFVRRATVPLRNAMIGLTNKRLIPALIQESGLGDPERPAGEPTSSEVSRLAVLLKQWRFEVTGTLSWRDAQAMAGGVLTRDFVPATLESRLVPGVFAAGEVLDVTGPCGGYNLQWAWASGYTAGLHAGRAEP